MAAASCFLDPKLLTSKKRPEVVEIASELQHADGIYLCTLANSDQKALFARSRGTCYVTVFSSSARAKRQERPRGLGVIIRPWACKCILFQPRRLHFWTTLRLRFSVYQYPHVLLVCKVAVHFQLQVRLSQQPTSRVTAHHQNSSRNPNILL